MAHKVRKIIKDAYENPKRLPAPNTNLPALIDNKSKKAKPKFFTPKVIILLSLAAVVFLYAGWFALQIVEEDTQNLTSIKSWQEHTTVDPETQEIAISPIDFTNMLAINPDIKGWIHIPGTDISYPVVQSQDNSYYLEHNASQEENRAGAIFIDYENSSDFTDYNTIIYGHRMNNGSMFAQLHKYEDPEFLEANQIFSIIDISGKVHNYRIFEVADVGKNLGEPVYRTDFTSPEEFLDWRQTSCGNSVYSFIPVENSISGNVVTLSTCLQGDGSKRFIVRAVEV